MPAVDKTIASARRNSQVLLILMISAVVLVASEADRWRALSRAREAISQWLVLDIFVEDFEDWWQNQESEKHSVGEQFHPFGKERLNAAYEHYYSGFGAVQLESGNGEFLVSVSQPSRNLSAPTMPREGLPDIRIDVTDVRADIPDMRPWRRPVSPSEAITAATKPLSTEEAAILVATVDINKLFRAKNPERAAQLPELLKKQWSADKRWLSLGAEREKASYQLVELAKGSGLTPASTDEMPSVYRSIERKVGSAAIKVPVLDIEMPSLIALWSLGALGLIVAALLQGQMTTIAVDRLAERQEDWLLLDAADGISLGLARAWLAGIATAPILISIGILLVTTLRWKAAEGSATQAMASGAAAMVLALAGGYVSFRMCRHLALANTALWHRAQSPVASLQRTEHGGKI